MSEDSGSARMRRVARSNRFWIRTIAGFICCSQGFSQLVLLLDCIRSLKKIKTKPLPVFGTPNPKTIRIGKK
eukprot:5176461-Amphidinium_carterae.1